MGWLDDLKKAVEGQKIPGLGDVGQVGGEIGDWFKKNAPTIEKYADAPGQAALAPETLPGSAAPKTGFFSPYPNSFDIGKGVQDITGGGSDKKKKAVTTATPPQPTGDPPQQQQSAPDAFTAGLGMFFSQYLAPMMQQINSQNQGLISQYGNAMNQALQQPLPAGVASVVKPYLAQNEQLMTLANNAGASQLTNMIPFQSMINALGTYGQGQQALASALPTAAANQLLAGGNTQGLGQMFANMGLANTPEGAAALSLLTQPSTLQQLTGGGKSSNTSQQSQQSITPIQVLPGQTPTATTGTGTQQPQSSNLANTAIAQQLAQAMLASQQPSAANANAQAATGYTP